jgi:hypothetical protein
VSDNRERDELAASPLEEPLAAVGVAIAEVWRILPKSANWQNASGTLAAAAIDAMEAAGFRRPASAGLLQEPQPAAELEDEAPWCSHRYCHDRVYGDSTHTDEDGKPFYG